MHVAMTGELLAVRLEAGEDVREAILDLCRQRGVKGGFIISGIGALQDPEIGYFSGNGKYTTRSFPGIHECLSLCGNLSVHGSELMAHLHVVMSDTEFQAFGGHLVGATVGVTLELTIQVVGENVRMFRETEIETGLPGLNITQTNENDG